MVVLELVLVSGPGQEGGPGHRLVLDLGRRGKGVGLVVLDLSVVLGPGQRRCGRSWTLTWSSSKLNRGGVVYPRPRYDLIYVEGEGEVLHLGVVPGLGRRGGSFRHGHGPMPRLKGIVLDLGVISSSGRGGIGPEPERGPRSRPEGRG